MAVEYDDHHFLLTAGGHMVGGWEEWQCGLRYAGPGGVPESLYEQAMTHISLQDIHGLWSTFFSSTVAGIIYPNWTTLEFVKLAFIGKDGNYLTDAREHRAQIKGKGAGSYTHPPQLAVVASLSSGSRIGRANHGRIYLPAPLDFASNVDGLTGKCRATDVTSLQAAVKSLLEGIHGEVSTVEVPTQLSIFSPKTPKSTAALVPSHKPVAQIGIGPVVDTHRSRRTSLPDGVTTWLTYAPSGG